MKGAAVAALVPGIALPPADVIPTNQRRVATNDFVTTLSQEFVLVSGRSVTVNNGSTARECVIQFSAEAANNELGDGVAVAFAIGGSGVRAAACNTSGGPEFFHLAEEGFEFETHTAVHVRQIGKRTKTVKACFRFRDVNGSGTGEAALDFRTLTVECRTQ